MYVVAKVLYLLKDVGSTSSTRKLTGVVETLVTR